MTQHPNEMGYKWIEGTNEKKRKQHKCIRERVRQEQNMISSMYPLFYSSEVAVLYI